jgi:hypothetical protein
MKSKPDDAEPQLEKVETKIYMDSRLHAIVAADCAKRGAYLSDLVAELLAEHFGRPDLKTVPRKRVGRKVGKPIKKRP